MNNRRHTPEQIVHKLPEANRMLGVDRSTGAGRPLRRQLPPVLFSLVAYRDVSRRAWEPGAPLSAEASPLDPTVRVHQACLLRPTSARGFGLASLRRWCGANRWPD